MSVYAAWQFNEYNIALEGNYVACIFSGIYFAIAGANLYLLRKKRNRILWLYSIVQLAVTIVFVAVALYAAPTQYMGIMNIGTDNGPEETSPWPAVVINVAFVINTWISDAFLLYRCYVVCMGNRYAVAFPAFIYLATVGSSCAWLIVSSVPGAVYSTYSVQVTGICYWSCSTAMNICASCLICVRLWMHRQAISAAVGSKQGAFYLGYMVITLESASLYTMFTIVTLALWTLNNPVVNVFIPVLGAVQAIAPSLIIHRIARGISFQTDEYRAMSTGTMNFASPDESRLTQRECAKTYRIAHTPYKPLQVAVPGRIDMTSTGLSTKSNTNFESRRVPGEKASSM